MQQLQLAMELMESEMELNMPPMAELFENVGNRIGGAVGQLLEGTALKLTAVPGRPPQTAMKIQLEEMPGIFPLQERTMLLELCGCLGRYDLRGQARALGIFKSRFGAMLLRQENEAKTKGKAWLTASVCGGLAVVVILV